MKAILTIGVSASGKTTWAEAFVQENEGWVNINRDDIRFSILGVKDKAQRDWSKWNWKREVEVSKIQEQLIFDAAQEGKNIIISDTNLNKKFRDKLIQDLNNKNYQVECKHFPISFEDAVKRDTLRANGVGYSVIAKQIEQYNAQFPSDVYVPEKDKPSAIIVDIDGTLAHMNGRSAFDWHRVGEDSVDEVVKSVVNMLSSENVVILLSGRDAVCYKQTRDWLRKNGVCFDVLHMRTGGDMRKDTIVKKEMFDNHIRDRYNVVCVIDDRPCVVRMWQQLGLKTLIVGNPYIEF